MRAAYHPPSLATLTDLDVSEATYTTEPVVVQGLVSMRSQGATVHDDHLTHLFSLAAWRRVGGPLMEQKLTVLRAVPKGHPWSADAPPGSQVRLTVYLSDDETRAVFLNDLGLGDRFEHADDDLLDLADELRRPTPIESDRFGALAENQQLDWMEGTATWNGATVRLTLSRGLRGRIDADDFAPALHTAEQLWADETTWKTRIDACAATLYDIWDGGWRLDEDTEDTPEAFVARMMLETIACAPDGAFECWYDDGDLFAGHAILVSGTLADGPTLATLAG
ncbi:MAG: DUF2262 domain-containing protein [Bacteroidota bacterium]